MQATVATQLLKQEIPLRHGQANRWLAGKQQAVRAHGVGLRVNLHLGGVVVVDHVLLFYAADAAHASNGFLQPEALGNPC